MIALLYSPFPTRESAEAAARALLAAKCVACCNLLPGTQSLYWWEGEIATAEETILIAKTSAEQATGAIAQLAALHPHACPAILSFVATANAPFKQWLSGVLADPE